MGNVVFCGIPDGGGRSGRRRKTGLAAAVVDDRFTRPRQLARLPSDVDYRRLRRLIYAGKLAPCFDGADEDPFPGELEECPICFLYYPSLNRSVCCGKGICTECFIQVKPSDITESIRCPFCNKRFYAVEHRGPRTDEERQIEIAEQKKVTEAKLRMQLESQDLKATCSRDTDSIHDSETALDGGDFRDVECGMDDFLIQSSCKIRSEEHSLGLEQIMLMEAMWESLQDVRLDKTKDSSNHELLKNPGSSSESSCSSNQNHIDL